MQTGPESDPIVVDRSRFLISVLWANDSSASFTISHARIAFSDPTYRDTPQSRYSSFGMSTVVLSQNYSYALGGFNGLHRWYRFSRRRIRVRDQAQKKALVYIPWGRPLICSVTCNSANSILLLARKQTHPPYHFTFLPIPVSTVTVSINCIACISRKAQEGPIATQR